jgi:DNA polymerase-3 subunit gamma/tau
MHVTEINKNLVDSIEKKKIDLDTGSSSTKPIKDKSKNFKEISKDQLKSTNQIQTDFKLEKDYQDKKDSLKITNLNDLVEICTKENELELKFDLERNVTLVSFVNGKIDIGFNENLNKNFIKNLTEKLLLWTGKRWIITLSKSKGEKTIFEKKKEKQNEEIIKFKDNKKFKEILEYFPDAKIDKIDGDNDA